MTVAGLICLITGFLMEILWLFKTSGNPKRPGWLRFFLHINVGILALAGLSTGVAVLTGNAEIRIPFNPGSFIIPGLLLVGFFIKMDDIIYTIMPRVTEQSILVVQFIALVSFIQSKPDLPTPIFLPVLHYRSS